MQKLDSKNPYQISSPVKRPWDQGGRTTRNAYQCTNDSMIDKNGDVWSCIVCGKIAADPKTKANLKRHTETHIKGIPWPCNLCGKVSGSKSGLAQHRTKYHKHEEEAMRPKEQLTTSIPDDCVINSMIEKHGDVWACSRCGKQAQDARGKANLRRHIEVHIEGVSYTCDICGKSSGSKNGLNQHKAKYHRHMFPSSRTNVPLMDPSHVPAISITTPCLHNEL